MQQRRVPRGCSFFHLDSLLKVSEESRVEGHRYHLLLSLTVQLASEPRRTCDARGTRTHHDLADTECGLMGRCT